MHTQVPDKKEYPSAWQEKKISKLNLIKGRKRSEWPENPLR